MSEKSIENITKSDSNFAPTFADHHLLPGISFNGHCLINNISILKKLVNLYIPYTLIPWLRILNTYFTLNHCLFGSTKLTKDADPDKCKYGSYGIGFDSCSEFSFTDGSLGRNVIIFGADMTSSLHDDNKNKNPLIIVDGTTKALDDTALATEVEYPINFTKPSKRFV